MGPFPDEMLSYTIVTAGGVFSRGFRVAFFGEPQIIAAWVRGCPGIADPKTTGKEAPDGTITI